MALLLVLAVVSLYTVNGQHVTVYVDPDHGDDTTCTPAVSGSTGNPNNPCMSINYAVWGNVSIPVLRGSNCSEYNPPINYMSLEVVLKGGTVQLEERLVLVSIPEVVVRSEVKGQSVIQCVKYPNTESGNFDNVFGCNVSHLEFRGVVFERCGPVPSNVFIYECINVIFDHCTFR